MNAKEVYLLSIPMSFEAGLSPTTIGIPCFLERNWPGLGCRHEASAPMMKCIIKMNHENITFNSGTKTVACNHTREVP